MAIIAPSILSADFTRLGEEIGAVEQSGADWIHVDVMDGHFVPNITMGPLVVAALNGVTDLPLDVHLMIENADAYIPQFARAGADHILVQAEACVHLHRSLQLIRSSGARPGVVLNPATPLGAIDWVLEDVEIVLIMGVNPGFGGQAFIPATLAKISALRRIIDDRQLPVLISVDGGVNPGTIEAVAAAGADVFIAGSAIFGQTDYTAAINSLREKLATAC